MVSGKEKMKEFLKSREEDLGNFKRLVKSHIYLRLIYKHKINKFLTKEDNIGKEYKNNIKKYYKKFGVRVNTDWHKWYSSRNGIEDVRYIPEFVYYAFIEPYFNRLELEKAYSDKSYLDIRFPDVKTPNEVCKKINGNYYDSEFNPINEKKILERCTKRNEVVVKPSIDSGGGKKIHFIEAKDSREMRNKVKKTIDDMGDDFIIQDIIEQHENLSKIHEDSVNTIRITSVLLDGKSYIPAITLKMGVGGIRLDNQSAGAISCGIKENGKLRKYAFDKFGKRFEKHPGGFNFEGAKIPSIDKIKKEIKKEHKKLVHFPIISWDFAVDKNKNPVLIEINLKYQGINVHQLNNGPLFGELTDRVLEEVFAKT